MSYLPSQRSEAAHSYAVACPPGHGGDVLALEEAKREVGEIVRIKRG